MTETAKLFLPAHELLADIPLEATHEDDTRFAQPVLEELQALEAIPQNESDESSTSSSDSEPEKDPSASECMVNIAADLHGNIWKRNFEGDFALDVKTDTVHMWEAGSVLCWKDGERGEARTRRRRLVYIDDPGNNEICKECKAKHQGSRKKRRAEASC